MKNKTIYFAIIFVLFVSLGIFGLQKHNIAKAATTIEFSGNPYMIFTVSLNKEKYVVGETATARITVNDANFDYRGVVTIAGKQYTFFNKEQFYADQFWSYSTSVETTPGNYNADFAITKYTRILFFTFQNTKHAYVPYTVYTNDSFRIDPQGSINMKVGDKIQLKAWYDDNIYDSIPEVNVTNL